MNSDRNSAEPARSGAGSTWSERLRAGLANAGQTAVPVVKTVGVRIGDWLVSAGWGKFFLVAILLLGVGGLAGNILYKQPSVVIETDDGADPVKVEVNVGKDGVEIRSIDSNRSKAAPPGALAPPVPPPPPSSFSAPTAPTPPSVPDTVAGADSQQKSDVHVDERGVHILSTKNGKRVAVVVDGKGVRIEKMPDAGAPTTRSETIVLPPEVTSDPEKMAEAVEAARQQVEQIVAAQVNRRVQREVRHVKAENSDWLVTFVMLLILTGIIVKVVLGGKKKAETRAQAATATAAEEGLKRQLAEAQLKMMQAQVEPHFLFNTLASVDYLIETDAARASKMQKNLIQYLRASLPQMREGSTTLGKEINLCRAYLEILKVRMDDRLQYSIVAPQGLLSAQFPPMMLQSLVENSIKHGLEPKAEGGSLTISADVANGNLRVTVADTGLGFDRTAKSGVGLSNIRERLVALYGGRAKLTMEAGAEGGTIATIEVPYSFEASPPAA